MKPWLQIVKLEPLERNKYQKTLYKNMKKVFLLLILILVLALLFGCAGGTDELVKAKLEDNADTYGFINTHPDYKMGIRAMTAANVERDYYFKNDCNGVDAGAYYKVTLSDEESGDRLIAFVDLGEGVMCAVKKGIDDSEDPDDPDVCVEDWDCSDWSPEDCPDGGEQERICTDTAVCGTTTNKPDETKTCSTESGCTEDWGCTPWSDCLGGEKTRTCTEDNNCGTIADKPAESGVCTSTCDPHWVCGQLGDCIDEVRTRVCIDDQNCGTTAGKPEEEYACGTDRCEDFVTEDGLSNNVKIISILQTMVDYNLGHIPELVFEIELNVDGTQTTFVGGDMNVIDIDLDDRCTQLRPKYIQLISGRGISSHFEAMITVEKGGSSESIIERPQFILESKLDDISMSADVNVYQVVSTAGSVGRLDLNINGVEDSLTTGEKVTAGDVNIIFDGVRVVIDQNINTSAIFYFGTETDNDTFAAYVDGNTNNLASLFETQKEFIYLEPNGSIDLDGAGDYNGDTLTLELDSVATPGIGPLPYEAEFDLYKGSSKIDSVVEITSGMNLKDEFDINANVFVRFVGTTVKGDERFVVLEVE